jgi:ferredoxin
LFGLRKICPYSFNNSVIIFVMDISAVIKKYFTEYAFCPIDGGQTVLLLKRDYTPYEDPGADFLLIDAYYPAANEVYHRTVRLIAELREAGTAAERYAQFGFKDLAVRSGLARLIRLNTLSYADRSGSRFVLGAILINQSVTDNAPTQSAEHTAQGIPTDNRTAATENQDIADAAAKATEKRTDAPSPQRETDNNCSACATRYPIRCKDCLRCVRACPTGAIAEAGFDRTKCLRQHMSDGAYPDAQAAKAAGRRLWGCDICQACCPANPDGKTPMPDGLRELLRTDGFTENISARVKGLAPWIGINYAKPEKLKRLAEQLAAVFKMNNE